jgi:pimeloyl-ACP methyl ester carboxylesterase
MPQSSDCQRARLARGIAVLCAILLAGCSATTSVKPVSCSCNSPVIPGITDNPRLACPERLDQGYTIVLPGIWGAQPTEYAIVAGLKDGNVPSAIELYDWTAGVARLVYNLRALDHNREQAQKIAAKIIAYQDHFPGRPVHVIGYSGGGGVAVLTLEAMPPGRRVTDAILLAPTLASDYDLQPAISHTTNGIRNFYSPLDVPILMVLSTAFGTTDGRHTPAAGAIGFETPKESDPKVARDGQPQVSQQSYDLAMILDGHPGGHFGWSNRTFIAKHVAPLLANPAAPLPPNETATAAANNAAPIKVFR